MKQHAVWFSGLLLGNGVSSNLSNVPWKDQGNPGRSAGSTNSPAGSEGEIRIYTSYVSFWHIWLLLIPLSGVTSPLLLGLLKVKTLERESLDRHWTYRAQFWIPQVQSLSNAKTFFSYYQSVCFVVLSFFFNSFLWCHLFFHCSNDLLLQTGWWGHWAVLPVECLCSRDLAWQKGGVDSSPRSTSLSILALYRTTRSARHPCRRLGKFDFAKCFDVKFSCCNFRSELCDVTQIFGEF